MVLCPDSEGRLLALDSYFYLHYCVSKSYSEKCKQCALVTIEISCPMLERCRKADGINCEGRKFWDGECGLFSQFLRDAPTAKLSGIVGARQWILAELQRST